MIDVLILLLLAPLILATLVFITETGLGAFPPARRKPTLPAYDPAQVVVLVPAHDEAAGIGAILAAQRAAMPAGMRLLVVADNCSDDTASVARAAGAEVIERHDPVRRGKGFALDRGRASLAAAPPACVIVVDADTVPIGDSLERLAALAIARGRPVQGAYYLTVGPGDGPVARFSAAAFFVKNMVRELGAARIGAPAILTGSGMAFPWPTFADLPLATGHVAEDLMLGVQCSLAGVAPIFEADARITGTGSSDRGTAVQRRRWESGFLQVAQDSALPLIVQALRRGRPALGWLGLHLLTPPLVLLLALDGMASLVAAGLLVAGVAAWPFWLMATLTLAAASLVVIGLAGHGRLDLLSDWVSIPKYLWWKLRLSLLALFRRETRWIRTDRD
ncbi:MAG TPA: glycosyltransferase family 2 protein [Sphingomonas sp.]|jgi:cellulose synthase/poly-beta-1,6-N-acetylglucosamine synthase-like glycosyltransferase